MVRKVVLGTLLVGLIGVLVAGAIISTVDKTENVAEARGLGQGRGEISWVELYQHLTSINVITFANIHAFNPARARRRGPKTIRRFNFPLYLNFRRQTFSNDGLHLYAPGFLFGYGWHMNWLSIDQILKH